MTIEPKASTGTRLIEEMKPVLLRCGLDGPSLRSVIGVLQSFDCREPRPLSTEKTPYGYTRSLLYADPSSRFSILSLAWDAGAATPVHGHHVWCLFGIVEGVLTERRYASSKSGLSLVGERPLQAGQIQVDEDETGIHRLANERGERAVSIHVYGVAGCNSSTGVNRVFAN